MWKCIEVVITGRTRNAVVLLGSWVRIPPLPPEITPAAGFPGLLALLFQFGTKPKPLSIALSKVSYEENRLSLYRDAEKETEDIFDRWTDEFDDLDEGYEPDKFFSD